MSFAHADHTGPADASNAGFETGIQLLEAGLYQEAATTFRAYLQHRGEDAEAWYNLGVACHESADLNAAAQAWRQAIEMSNPTQTALLQAIFDAADELYQARAIPEALDLYRRLKHVEQLSVHVTQRLSWNLHQIGQDQMALAELDQAVERWPLNPGFRLMQALLLPRIYMSVPNMRWWRQHLLKSLDQLEAWLQSEPMMQMSPMQLHSPIFDLMSQGENELPVLRRISAIWQRIFVPPQPTLPPRQDRHKIRLGLVTVSAYHHSTMHYFLGMLELLALQPDFETGMFYFGDSQDAWTDRIRALSNDFIHQPPSLPHNLEAIRDWQPDILFYLDIGQEALLYTLAHLRLAPIQCVSAGIPMSTGIPTIDYYLSSRFFERPDAQQYYSETLVQLEHPMVCMRPPELNQPLKPRSAWELPEQALLYIFPHTLIRVDPELDDILARLLLQNPKAEIVFIQDAQGQLSQCLQARFGQQFPHLLPRLRFVAPMAQADFLNLVACCDVALDGLRLGGGNVTYQCFWVGTPIVHCPSPFLRCRIAAGLYRLAGLEAWIASDWDDYLNKALLLGRDPDVRAQLSRQILAAREQLFNQAQGIEEMLAHFRSWTGR